METISFIFKTLYSNSSHSDHQLRRSGRIIAWIDLAFAVFFLVFAAIGLSFRFAGFIPTGIVFAASGAVLLVIFQSSRRQGYPFPGKVVTSHASLKLSKEEAMTNPMVGITLKSGLSDQVHIFVEDKEVVSSSWTFGRKRAYDLIVGGKKMKMELRRGVGGPKYELYSDGTLLSEGKLEPDSSQ